MRVLALYDVHGNLDALEAVLADPAVGDVDAVVVGGDAVPGPQPEEVLARLRAIDAPQHWVRGNGEREVATAARGSEPVGGEDMAQVTARANAAELDPATTAWLADLPLTVELDGVVFCHATPRSDEQVLTRASPTSRYAATLEGVRTATVVSGHTHQQHERDVGGTKWVNAGSVGLPYEGDGGARWLLVLDGLPELHRTPYDAAGAGRRFLAAGWPDVDSITASLVDPIDPQVVTDLFEERSSGA